MGEKKLPACKHATGESGVLQVRPLDLLQSDVPDLHCSQATTPQDNSCEQRAEENMIKGHTLTRAGQGIHVDDTLGFDLKYVPSLFRTASVFLIQPKHSVLHARHERNMGKICPNVVYYAHSISVSPCSF